MDEKTIKRFEYEEQIFHFSSHFFAECFKNFLQSELDLSVDVLVNNYKKKLLKETKNPDIFISKLHEMESKLKAEYKKSLETEFSVIQEQISNFFYIPEHVLLKEDLPVRTASLVNMSDIKAEVDDLKNRYKALVYLKEKINYEIETAGSVIFILDNIVDKNKADLTLLNTNELNSLRKYIMSLID